MNREKSRSSLVLMELIITVLFFSLASAVCVQLFVKSHLIAKETEELNNAINVTQSIAEMIGATDGNFDTIKLYIPEAVGTGDSFIIYYDEKFGASRAIDSYEYTATAVVSKEDGMMISNVIFKRRADDNVIYELKATDYLR